jgi:hypothetical protein
MIGQGDKCSIKIEGLQILERIEFPRNAVRIFKGYIILLQSLIQFNAGIFDIVVGQRPGNPLQFCPVIAAQRDVVQADPEWIEPVVFGYFPLRALERDGGCAGEENEQFGLIEDGLEAKLINVEGFGSGHIRDSDGNVMNAGRFDLNGHIHFTMILMVKKNT